MQRVGVRTEGKVVVLARGGGIFFFFFWSNAYQGEERKLYTSTCFVCSSRVNT